MSIFDLLFMVVFLASLVTLAVAAVSAIRRRLTEALRILGTQAICAAGYVAVATAVAFFKPQRLIQVGDPWCFDDWCLTVETVSRMSAPTQVSYNLALRIFSRARRVAQRAKGAWIYLIDDKGRRYSSDRDPSGVPLDVLLQPGESVTTTRVFRVPAHVRHLGLITGHGGPYCGLMGRLIIGGGGCLFNKPTMIQIE